MSGAERGVENGHRLDLGLTEAGTGGSCCGGGACGSTAPTQDRASTQEALAQVVLVEGMTCGHCVASVTEELGELPEVQGVTVDLRAGGVSRVSIATSAPIDDDRIRSAVEEAGYAVANAGA